MEPGTSQRLHSGPQTRCRTKESRIKPSVTFCSGVCKSCPKSGPNDIIIPAMTIKVEPIIKQEISSPLETDIHHDIDRISEHFQLFLEDMPVNLENLRQVEQREDPRLENRVLTINLDASEYETYLHQLCTTKANPQTFVPDDNFEMPEEQNILDKENYTLCIDKVGSLIFKHLNLDNLLNCRRLSKSWLQAVDAFLEDPSQRILSAKEKESTQKHILAELDNRNIFNHQASINNFTRQFVNIGGINPFLGKCATFSFTVDTIQMRDELQQILDSQKQCIYPEEARQLHQRRKILKNKMKSESLRYWRYVEQFLSQFGSHIWYLTIKQQECGLTPCRLYEIIEMCLGQTPKLKTLVVQGHFEKLVSEDKSTSIKSTSYYKYKLIMQEHNLRRKLESKPLTPQQNLQCVRIHLDENVCDDYECSDTQMVYAMYKNKLETLYSSVLWKEFEPLNEVGACLNLIW